MTNCAGEGAPEVGGIEWEDLQAWCSAQPCNYRSVTVVRVTTQVATITGFNSRMSKAQSGYATYFKQKLTPGQHMTCLTISPVSHNVVWMDSH